uniref:Succinate dehydrogenase cytochrome b560 subunit, mitochondrial n=1 Tax=Macrostomum lignano TaxID=282301 RepID=A0A1I8HGS8_9PLAT
MITSLIHRVSGIAMGLAWPVLGVAGFYAAGNWSRVVDWARGSQLGYPVVFRVYHMINGIRHLCYDLGYGFDLALLNRLEWLSSHWPLPVLCCWLRSD